jgi:hypothetical protein
MEADWEFEVGGDATVPAASVPAAPVPAVPVIDALWPGFIDLRRSPERIAEIQEAAAFPPLAAQLKALNCPESPLWTSKCDLWEPEPDEQAAPPPSLLPRAALACYIDLLPLAGQVFAHAQQAETLCREWVAALAPLRLPECRVDLVIRQAIAGQAEGFGITAYLSAVGNDGPAAAQALAAALAAFADTIPHLSAPQPPASKLQ